MKVLQEYTVQIQDMDGHQFKATALDKPDEDGSQTIIAEAWSNKSANEAARRLAVKMHPYEKKPLEGS